MLIHILILDLNSQWRILILLSFNSSYICDTFEFRYNKLAERIDDKMHMSKGSSVEGDSFVEEMVCTLLSVQTLSFYPFRPFLILVYLLLQSTELHLYTDFLRIVLEIINAILTYALPRNPEVLHFLFNDL